MKKHAALAEVIGRITHDFVDAVVREAARLVAHERATRPMTRQKASAEPHARPHARAASRLVESTNSPRASAHRPPPDSTRLSRRPAHQAERSGERARRERAMDELGAAVSVVDPERLLAAIDQGEHRTASMTVASTSEISPPASSPTLDAPASASTPSMRAPALRPNERAITTRTGAIVIRRPHAAA